MPPEEHYLYGYEAWTRSGKSRGEAWSHTKVTPLRAPIRCRWRIGLVSAKKSQPPPGAPGQPATGQEEITMQLTADQQVELSITGQDAYGNSVDVSGDTEWHSSDDSIVSVQGNGTSATATAVGPAGTAAVTVSNDVDQDGTGDFQGSLAIDVVSGRIAEIRVQQGQVTDKQGNPVEQPPVVDNTLPTGGDANTGGDHVDNTLPTGGDANTGGDHVDNTLPNPDDQPHPDISGPGDQPVPDEGNLPYVDPRSRRK